MKITKYILALTLCATTLSCTSDNDEGIANEKGNITLKFDNGVGDQDFAFETTFTKSNNESFELSTLKYIISNISLEDNDGNIYEYPTEENVFIIDEADGNNAGEIFVTLSNVDAASYTSISFGIGIDQNRFALGAEGQGDFLAAAQEKGMMWAWATGYKFIRIDGTYSSTNNTDEALNIHMGSVGTTLDNYREVTLSLPNSVKVSTSTNPEIHIKADIAKVFDGDTSLSFENGFDQVHTDANETPIVAQNISGMFMVHHVHNN